MDEDDDGPPMLIAADGGAGPEATLNVEMRDVKISKVPITIITGKTLLYALHDPGISVGA